MSDGVFKTLKAFENASWIWIDEGEQKNAVNSYADFFTPFNYGKAANGRVTLKISADSQYAAYINGQAAAFGQYADYPHYKVYDEVDITAYLKEGENRLAVQAYYYGESSSVYCKGNAALMFEITDEEGNVLAESGTDTFARKATEFFSGDYYKVSPQLSFSFGYKKSPIDWFEDPEKDMGFLKAVTVKQNLPLHKREIEMLSESLWSKGKFIAQGTFFLNDPYEKSPSVRMQSAYLSGKKLKDVTSFADCLNSPVRVLDENNLFKSPLCFSSDFTKKDEGLYVIIDLTEQKTGFLSIDIETKAGTKIDIGYGEHLDDLRVRTEIDGRCFGIEVHADQPKTLIIHRLHRISGRYLQLFVYADEFKLNRLSINPTDYPMKKAASFSSSDSLHNEIYRKSLHTLKNCMHVHYEDCPWREQALYAMDSRNQMLFTYYAFGDFKFSKASLRLMSLGHGDDGLLPLCSPSDIPINIPTFSLFWIIALYEYALFSKDFAFPLEMLRVAEKILNAFVEKADEKGLVSRFTRQSDWNFYEWVYGLDGNHADIDLSNALDAPLNILTYIAISSYVKLCSFTGVEPVFKFVDTADKIKKIFHTVFWNKENGMYTSFVNPYGNFEGHFSQYVNSLAVCSGLCPDEFVDSILEKIAYPPKNMHRASLSCLIFKYDALMKREKHHRFVTQDIADIFGKMLYSGASTLWEVEEGAAGFDLAGSLCHGWSAVPIYVYFKYVLGIQPCIETGSEGFVLEPFKTDILKAGAYSPLLDERLEIYQK